MFLFDWIMKVPDTYWKREYNAERIRREKAESDAAYYKQTNEQLEEDRNRLSEKDICQAHAIDVFNREIDTMRAELAEKDKAIESKDREIVLLHEALRSERDLSTVLKTNSRLWERVKGANE